MSKDMTLEKFDELALAYGGSLDRWPDGLQHSARAFLTETPAAQQLLAEAQTLDGALDALPAPQPSDALMTRILGDAAEIGAQNMAAQQATATAPAAEPKQQRSLFGWLGGAFFPAMGLTACLALGFTFGISDPLNTTLTDSYVMEEGDLFAAILDGDAGEFDLFFDDGELLL